MSAVRRLHLRSRCVLFLAAVVVLGAVGAAIADSPGGESPFVCERADVWAGYTVCVWRSRDAEAPGYYRIVTIDHGETRLVCEDWATGLNRMSGVDIDGTGYPNVIIEKYSGGAHCCFSTSVYDLGETLTPVDLPPSPGGNSPGEFEDLNGDGVFEFLTADDSFAYAYCCFAGSPAVPVVLVYSPAVRRYVPASFKYPGLYCEAIARDAERARAASSSADLGWDGTGKCEVLPLVLDYLYSGDTAAAWEALAAYYPWPDCEAFRAEIEAVVASSPYYAAPLPQP